ncbi:hypothetical protein HPB47_002156 [Ixodes persulcatus]|uniref:Uncharacterized protein n=1 Tax=Ixodes persulcatus TaxID=34615 RepID=A0AC60PNK0_IXOPE|nr:hypothetical protein HPB47_002156 [Ixodes persulcatus]
MGIKHKAKNNRRRGGAGIPEIDAAKETAKRQKQAKAARLSAEGPSSTAVCRRQVAAGLQLDSGEDEISLMGHMNFMKKQMRRTIVDEGKVKLSMDRTFVARRAFIDQERRLVNAVLDDYPALATEAEVRNEFFRLTKVQAKEAIEAMVKNYGDKIIALAAAKRRLELTHLSQDDYQYPLTVLMSLVRERLENFISQLEVEDFEGTSD